MNQTAPQAALFDAGAAGIADGDLIVFDTETSGVDYDTSRIVTFSIGLHRPSGQHTIESGVIDSGIDIPEGAAAVHGWTTERVRSYEATTTPEAGIRRMLSWMAIALKEELAVVAFNARFDMTLLARETERINMNPDALHRVKVIDPLVLDKGLDRFRRGSRRLRAVCQHHKIDLDEDAWHDAKADAIAAGNLTRVLLGKLAKTPEAQTLAGLHTMQSRWARDQAASLESHLHPSGKNPTAVVERIWPIAPKSEEAPA